MIKIHGGTFLIVFLVCLLTLVKSSIATGEGEKELTISDLNKSTIKIICNVKAININYPWVAGDLTQDKGSAFIVKYNGENKILTNAHVVERAVSIRLRKVGEDKEYAADIEYISSQRDLALLSPKDKDFFKGTVSLELTKKDESIDIGDTVSSYGFPVGGKTITMTKGVISSVDFSAYCFTGYDNIVYQVDAAINPGKSGGPAISHGKVVGVNFQTLLQAQNVGYIIPSSVIQNFFDDIERSDKPYPQVNEVPFISINVIPLQNPQLRKVINVAEEETGVLITELSGLEKDKQLLNKNDVLMAIDDFPIGNQGNINLSKNDNISWRAIISAKQLGDNVALTLKRKGEIAYINYPLTHTYSESYLIPSDNPVKDIDYMVIGGVVIIEMTQNIYKIFEPYNFPHISKLPKKFRRTNSSIDDRVVIISNVLYNQANAFYEQFRYSVIEKFDDKHINNLKQLKQCIEDSRENRKDIMLQGRAVNSQTVFLGFTWDDLDEQRQNIIDAYGPTNNVF